MKQDNLLTPAKGNAKISNWTAIPNKKNPRFLIGTVTHHIRQGEFQATTQRTSSIVSFNFEEGYVETLNTIYTLGEEQEETK